MNFVVLLDEPLSGLDAQLHAALRVEIAGLLRSVGATGINVTHDQFDAMAMADRVAVVSEGKVEQLGTPDDLYDRPASLFVAQFVGIPPMNTVEVADDGTSPFGCHRFQLDGRVYIGVRPENLHFVGAATSDEDWTVDGVVALIEPNGADRVVHVEVGNQPERQVFAVRCRVSEQPALNASVRLAVDPANVHVFSGAGGRHSGTASELGLIYFAATAT
jgi:multiple sugar transport system ATP-binding protein